jgi:outer membrane lipoprotein-sorting protein
MTGTRIAWIVMSVLPSIGAAQTPEGRGPEIAAEADRRATGFSDLSAELRMVIRGGRGEERTRELTIAVLNVAGGEERTLVRFDSPRDLRGTALLTVTAAEGSNAQWLYMPALRRVNRLAGATRTGSFMGSEFAYEDIGAMAVEQYTHRLVKTDTLDGHAAWVVERRPKDASSLYSRQLVWFDQQEYRVLRIDFYDRDHVLLKTLRLRNFQQYEGQFWRPDEMVMLNHQTGASTLLEWRAYVFGAGLTRRDFEPNRLDREG